MATTKKKTTAKKAAPAKSGSKSTFYKTVKKADDYVQKKDPNLSKSKTYGAVKSTVKDVSRGIDKTYNTAAKYGKKAVKAGMTAADIISNPGKYIEKGAAAVGKLSAKGAKAIDDAIQKADPNLSKSKVYGAIKGAAKDVVKSKVIEKAVGTAGKAASMLNPAVGSAVMGREGAKGAIAAGKYAKAKVKQGAKAIDDAVEKADPYLSKSKAYGAIKGTAKSALGVKSGSTAKKTAPAKTSTTKTASTKKKTTASKPKVTGQSFLDVATGAKKASDYSVKNKPATPAKTASPTVSQLWQQKTGTSWSEAKKQGLTDGSAKSNIALMKKLQSGSVNKNTVKADSAKKTFEKEMNQNIQDELSGKTSYPAPTPASKGTADKAADENKMRRGGMVRRRMQAGGDTTTVGGYVAKGNPGKNYESYKKAISKKPSKVVQAPGATKQMKTGGMVNSNSKVSAIKSAGSKGVRVGANTRATAARAAKGRVGGISKAPRTATPKARMGMSVRRRR